MCQPASFVLTETDVYWSRFSDRHEDIIREHKLSDGTFLRPNIVRVEVLPPNYTFFDRPLDEWRFVPDQDVLPGWYDAHRAEMRTRQALKQWAKAKVITRELTHRVYNGQYYCVDALVRASDGARVHCFGKSTVHAFSNSYVEAHNYSTVFAMEDSIVEAHDRCYVTALERSRVRAYGYAVVSAEGYAAVHCIGAGQVVLAGASCMVSHRTIGKVVALDYAMVRAYGQDIYVVSRDATVQSGRVINPHTAVVECTACPHPQTGELYNGNIVLRTVDFNHVEVVVA